MRLAIECGIGRGSFAVWNDGEFVAQVSLKGNLAQTVEIISSVRNCLDEHSLSKSALKEIICGFEVGSATGNRIAGAVSLGIQTGLDISVSYQNVFKKTLQFYSADLTTSQKILCLSLDGNHTQGLAGNRNSIDRQWIYRDVKFGQGLEDENYLNFTNDYYDRIYLFSNDFNKNNTIEKIMNNTIVLENLPAFYLGIQDASDNVKA